MDALAVKALAAEIQPLIVGATLLGTRSPHPSEMILTFRGEHGLHSLLISVDARFYRAHLTHKPLSEGGLPGSHIAETLRSRARGGRCSCIEVPSGERVFSLEFEIPELTGEMKRSKLVIELMGKHSNAILLDGEGVIISSLKVVQAYQSRHREIRPGKPYVAPPTLSSPDLGELSSSDMEYFAKTFGSQRLDKALIKSARRMSPLLVKLVLAESGLLPTSLVEELPTEERETLRRYINAALKLQTDNPASAYRRATGEDFIEDRFPVSATLRNTIGRSARLDRFHAKVRSVRGLLKSEWEKIYKRHTRLTDDLAAIPPSGDMKLKADLIMCHLGTIDPHAKTVRLEDVISGSGKLVEIEIKHGRTPQQTAQDLYNSNKRLSRKRVAVEKQLKDVTREMARAQGLLDRLGALLDSDDPHSATGELDEIAAEIVDSRLLPFDKVSRLTSDVKQLRKLLGDIRQKFPAKVHRYKTTDGLLVLVGGNDTANEFLRVHVAQATDLWFHVRGAPGSHVWLRKGEQKITERDLLEASHIAAWHSKARESTKVTVIHTQGKHLRKPPGSAPGLVTFVKERSVLIDPDEELVLSLKLEETPAKQ